jgi:intracellular sulfur oxidation DsrE/DsrF family protein
MAILTSYRIPFMLRRPTLALALLAAAALPVAAQRPTATPGPVIMSGGAVFDVPSPTFATPLDHDYRVVFEINQGTVAPAGAAAATAGGPNQQLNTVARFFNLHARAGVPRSRIHLAAVVHGTAGKDLLDDETHKARYGTANPSAALVKELLAAGVQVILCGQTAMGRDVPVDHLIPGVQYALSAMTAMTVLQSQGYTFNPW